MAHEAFGFLRRHDSNQTAAEKVVNEALNRWKITPGRSDDLQLYNLVHAIAGLIPAGIRAEQFHYENAYWPRGHHKFVPEKERMEQEYNASHKKSTERQDNEVQEKAHTNLKMLGDLLRNPTRTTQR